MPAVSTRDDARLNELRSQYQAKHDEADRIINDPAATGEQLVKAEKLYDERDGIKSEIEKREADLGRADSLRDRAAAGKSWQNEAVRTLPFSGVKSQPGFTRGESEDAGHVDMKFDAQSKLFRAVNEAGPGTFGEKQWEILSSFEYKRDFTMYLRKGARHVDFCTKTLQEGIDDQGGVFAPAELINRIIGRLPAPTRLRGLVNNLTTGRDSVVMPRTQYNADDKYSTGFRSNWSGEIPADGTGAQGTVTDTGLLGNLQVPIHTNMINGSYTKNMAEDSAFPLQPWIEGKFNEVIDLLYEDMIINGSGVGQPFGILLGASASNTGNDSLYPEVVLSGTAASITHDGLIDIQTALPPQYESPSTRWVMNKKNTYRALNKIKDQQLRPLFTTGYNDSGLVNGRGRLLLGDQVVLSQFMPDVGASNYPIIYGDLTGYYLFQRVGFSLQVLDQTRAKIGQIELVGRVRFGGKTIEPWKLKIQKSNNS